jgi:SAM-dependent methyltransferase
MNKRPHIDRAAIKQRKKIFFYAEDEAAAYDTDAELNTMHYKVLHNFMMELVSEYSRGRVGAHQGPREMVFLDIGSGTGEESIAILSRYPQSRVVAVDLCRPMHGIFRQKLREHLGSAARNRVAFVTGDIADGEKTWKEIKRALAKFDRRTKFDFVVSALALHHLTMAEKQWVYREIYQVTKPAGVFINADAFGFWAQSFDQLAQEKTLDWIRTHHDLKTTSYSSALRRLGARADVLAKKWVEHCQKYNIPLPIDSGGRDGRSSMGRDGVQCEASMLAEAGFQEIECPYRFWQTGIVAAVR